MELRFKDKGTIFNVAVTIFAAVVSVGMMLYGVWHFGLQSVCVGITVLLRDILFAPQLPFYSLRLACLTLSVIMLVLLTYFYARKDWETYSKSNLWLICIIDILIATLYNIDIFLEPADETSTYMMVEIWIRPTITYGLVACFVKGKEK